MKRPRASFLGGLSVQLLAFTVLPLTLLLVAIALGSISLHQRDMRALVGQRDERAVQSAAAALASELHHRAASISNLALLAAASYGAAGPPAAADLESDFDGGIAFLDSAGELITSSGQPDLWKFIDEGNLKLASPAEPGPIFSEPFSTARGEEWFVVVSQFSASAGRIVAGAFSPDALARPVLAASYPASSNLTVFLIASTRQVLFAAGPAPTLDLSADHPGLAEALRGETGTAYIERENQEHVVAYSPVAVTGWALITEEEWQQVVSPSLQATQMAPLVLVPAFLLALLALWFVARRIVQPLQDLETRAAALAWGDFEAIKEPVGGIPEVRHLQLELAEMSRKVQAAQDGLRDYIGAITSAQEEERTRLARELHDDTIQAVIALKQRVQLAQKTVKDAASRRTLSELETLSEQTIEGLRRMTRALRPIYLEDLGLVTALEMLAREMGQNQGIEVEFRMQGEEQRLAPEIELALYRIAQEALNNVVRHAHAERATLRVEFGEKEIILEVKDEGIGFQMPTLPTDLAPEGHFGLLGIRERADLIGGRLEVQSAPGEGTRLAVRLSAQAGRA
jgi:two-component system sensor histidine kinase UhpB